MKLFFISLFSLLVSQVVVAQYFLGAHTVWDDSFREWNIVLEEDSTIIEGSLGVSFGGVESRFDNYDFRFGELFGNIERPFKNQPFLWQLRLENDLVEIRSVWPNDPSEWKISTKDFSVVIRSRYTDVFDEWLLTNDKYGHFYLYTDIPGDVRDWVIEDYMSEDIPLSIRLALVFIVIHTSSPKV